MKPTTPADNLKFIFTETSFQVDQPGIKLNKEEELLKSLFLEDKHKALFQLCFEDKLPGESPSLRFLKTLTERFMKVLTAMPELEIAREKILCEPDEDTLDDLICAVPFGIGTEHIGRAWISLMFSNLNQEFSKEISAYDGTVQMFLTEKTQKLRVPERVFFHLVENKDDDSPFAFLATYATRDKKGQIIHKPLSFALTEYKNDREKLIVLLSCLNKVAEVSPLLGSFIESGEMFHPLRLESSEAYEFLKEVPEIEKCGVLCRVPNWWKRKYSSVAMSVSLGSSKPSMLGFETLVSMTPKLTVNGEELTEADIRYLLQQTEGLAYLKGKWVEVDHARLNALLKELDKYKGDLTLLEALRLETGFKKDDEEDEGPQITNGKWLGEFLQKLRRPSSIKQLKPPATLKATLRPYQLTGYNWLALMQKLGFGACLADDMGLGKTLQALTFLEKLRKTKKGAKVLLIVPASLIGNWEKEAARFTPSADVHILHGRSAKTISEELKAGQHFLNITTYGMASRIEALQEITWDCLILDEAQAIKNPGTKQTRTIKKIPASQKIAMTGTPIENDLTNLWSLFDFLNKGLLGTASEFGDYTKSLDKNAEGYAKLKNMVSPFILRRLKTDKSIIADLPDKLEQVDYVELSKKQVVLYRKQVSDLERTISEKTGMERRGAVLAAITKLKQICNHPDQFMGQETYDPDESGKFGMLKSICETIYEKRERVLVFTQYKEITEHLAKYLETIFKCKGLVLHGGTRIKRRQEMVDEFNGEEYVPFMILSVKAGGTGLNLVKANHVIHFDRWWNPAVENQATDRAFRIGQTKNVMVHKLVSEGTIEEKIDEIISGKKQLAENVIGSGGENWITELNNQELLNLMRLDI